MKQPLKHYTNITGSSIASGNFTASRKYLIFTTSIADFDEKLEMELALMDEL